MRLSQQAAALPIKTNNTIIFPLLVWDGDKNLVLIDAGFPGQLELFRAEFATYGFAFKDLTHILLTHQDLDHIGNLKELLKEASHALVLAHVDEAPSIRGAEPPSKTVALHRQREQTPDNLAKFEEQVANYQNFTVKVDQELHHDDVIPVCGGIRVIHTPGHTAGHVCYYIERDKLLMTGDTVSVRDGHLTGAVAMHTPDMALAAKSNQKLADYPAEILVGYHGGVYHGDISEAIKKLT